MPLKLLIWCTFILNLQPLLSQNHVIPSESNDTTVFTIVEVMPSFPGGDKAWIQYLSENIKYPIKASTYGISGRVYINFIIEKDGAVSNVKVLRGIGAGCDEEALRVIYSMPKWNQGFQRGKPVRVHFMTSIQFKLNTDNTIIAINDKHFSKGVQNLKKAKYNKAIEYFNKSVENNYELINESLLNIAICKMYLGDHIGADEELKKVIEKKQQ
ncbi:MAG: TonB family protein [Bacteroidales bacterium]|nr:TonB family protein [Bacteroidales bacterium]